MRAPACRWRGRPAPASLLVLRRAARGQLCQAQVSGQRLVHGLVREGDRHAVRQWVDDANRGRQLPRGVVRPILRGQRQSRGHPPALAWKDRGQGRLDALAGDDLVVLIDEDDLERPCRVEPACCRIRVRSRFPRLSSEPLWYYFAQDCEKLCR